MIQRTNDLATQALMIIENGGLQQKKRASMTYPSATAMLSSNAKQSSAMKRSRSALSRSFDMGDFLKASEQVEETIAFPTIEWPSFDDDYSSSDEENSFNVASSLTRPREEYNNHADDDDEDEDFSVNPRKRQCRGLTRCDRSCNLSSLWEISNRSERRGSNGSLS